MTLISKWDHPVNTDGHAEAKARTRWNPKTCISLFFYSHQPERAPWQLRRNFALLSSEGLGHTKLSFRRGMFTKVFTGQSSKLYLFCTYIGNKCHILIIGLRTGDQSHACTESTKLRMFSRLTSQRKLIQIRCRATQQSPMSVGLMQKAGRLFGNLAREAFLFTRRRFVNCFAGIYSDVPWICDSKEYSFFFQNLVKVIQASACHPVDLSHWKISAFWSEKLQSWI